MSLVQSLLGSPTINFCESAGSGIIARPGYAFSNMIYFAVGIYLLAKKESKIAKSFGVLALMVGAFSMIYDITYTYGAQLLDLFGMFLFVSFILVLNLKRINPRIRHLSKILFLIAFFSVILTFFIKGYSGDVIFTMLILFILLIEFYVSKNSKRLNYQSLFIAIVLICIGAFIWIFDAFQIWCSPATILNGRAIFHYLTAIAIVYISRFYGQFKEI